VEEVEDFAVEFAGLAKGRGEDQGEGGGGVESLVESADGGSCGFAPLAGAVDDDAVLGRVENLGLGGVWGEVEAVPGPF